MTRISSHLATMWLATFLFCLLSSSSTAVEAFSFPSWSSSTSKPTAQSLQSQDTSWNDEPQRKKSTRSLLAPQQPTSRRNVFMTTASTLIAITTTTTIILPTLAQAYTPDSDPLRESIYLVSRVQEATCLQERYIEKNRPPLAKMKLTLRLVDRSYKLLDQVNYISKFIDSDRIVAATQSGNEAVDALQEAIDFVYNYGPKSNQDGSVNMTVEQKDFLKSALQETREKIFDFLDYLPDSLQPKVLEARKRVEEENALNKDEFDPDLATDAGVYNPIVLPWKNRQSSKTT